MSIFPQNNLTPITRRSGRSFSLLELDLIFFRVSRAHLCAVFLAIYQKLTRPFWVLHQNCVVGGTRRSANLKESRRQHLQIFTPTNHVFQVSLDYRPLHHCGCWCRYPRKNTAGRECTSGINGTEGIGLSDSARRPLVILIITSPVTHGVFCCSPAIVSLASA